LNYSYGRELSAPDLTPLPPQPRFTQTRKKEKKQEKKQEKKRKKNTPCPKKSAQNLPKAFAHCASPLELPCVVAVPLICSI
jgi:hypothetical protein